MPKFRLQTALKVRERIEKLKMKELAQQLQISQNIKSQIDGIHEARASSNSSIDQSKITGFTTLHLQLHDHYQSRLKYQLGVLERQVYEQEQVVGRKRKELVEATQKKKVLEILKEKEEKKFREEQERRERIEMDEISQNLHRANRARG